MTLFVFDFDGVLFDTARECLQIAYQTVRVLPWAGRWRDLVEVPADDAELFLRHRGWVGPPWQYAVLFRCIAERALPASTDAFLAIAERDKAQYAGFTDTYFATRTALAADRARWLALAKPIEAAGRTFVALHDRGVARILSTRDDDSIRAIAGHYLGIEPQLLPRSAALPKWRLLLDAAAGAGLSPSRLFFIDDHIAHALPAFQRGIAARLATWGYAGPDDVTAALTAGVPCLQLDELPRAITAHQEPS
jgi:phosphoglycolate phosphatase-like HAD superfamily hydrolase